MVTKHDLSCFDEFTARFIRGKVRQLIGRAGFRMSDREDLLEDFVENLIRRREKFDPGEGSWEAFVVVVCQNRFASILEHRRAKKRSRDREDGSLNRPIRDAEGKPTEVGATLPDSQVSLRTGCHQRPRQEASDLVQDIDDLLGQLSPRLRELCEQLKYKSISSTARELGISRAAAYALIRDIRARFERSSLNDYLK